MVRATVVSAVLVLAGCQAVSNPFVHMTPDYSSVPTEAITAVAAAIEAAVASGNRAFTLTDREGLVVTDERVVQAVRTRIARSELITEFMDSGHAWERSNGLIAIQRTREYKRERNRRQKDRDALLIVSENQDRWSIYEGLLKANNLSPRALSAIQEIFYTARIPVLASGHVYEDASGQRVTK